MIIFEMLFICKLNLKEFREVNKKKTKMIEPQYKKNCMILLSTDYSTNLTSIIHFKKSLQVFERMQR